MSDDKYRKYIAWMRLTHNGRRGRKQMSPKEQAEYDGLGFGQGQWFTDAELQDAKRLYMEATAADGNLST
jgi:hypothetical protein